MQGKTLVHKSSGQPVRYGDELVSATTGQPSDDGGALHREDAEQAAEDANRLNGLSTLARDAVDMLRASCLAPGDWGLAIIGRDDRDGTTGQHEARFLRPANRNEPSTREQRRALVSGALADIRGVPGLFLVDVDGYLIEQPSFF